MYQVEFFNAADRIHDMRPIAADSEREALSRFHAQYVIGCRWYDSVTVTNVTKTK